MITNLKEGQTITIRTEAESVRFEGNSCPGLAAYVALPKTSKFYGKYYEDRIFDDLNIHVHGGLTYSGMGLKGLLEEKAYLIGWDYAHYRDFTGYAFSNPFFLSGDEKKWSTEEIFEEVKEVIDEIIKEEADND